MQTACVPDDEWLDWYRLTPAQRWRETGKLWSFYLAVGGSLDPEPDSESPFDTVRAQGTRPVDGRPGLRVYGASEFSRDTDLTLLASEDNLALLRSGLRDLHARRIDVPPFEQQFLLRGHAVHFRCYHPDALNMRVDIMAVMRGVDRFDLLWERRTHLVGDDDQHYDLVSLQDLVRSKKTQRDKDWPMIRRLVEADYVARETPSGTDVEFWLRESRTPAMLINLASLHAEQAEALIPVRPFLSAARNNDERGIEAGLQQEEHRERESTGHTGSRCVVSWKL